KAKQLTKYLRSERADYGYLKSVFRHLRIELEVEVPRAPKKLPYVPTEKEIERYYDVVWKAQNTQDMVMIKTLLYTDVRVSELVHNKRADVDFTRFQIRINHAKAGEDRLVPFPASPRQPLALHAANGNQKGAGYVVESSW